MALRRAARAVQAGDAEIVACVAGDTNHVDSFRQNLANFSRFARDAVYPFGAGGPNASFALLTSYYMRQYGIAGGGLRQALRRAARQRAEISPSRCFKKPLTLDEYLNARPIADPLQAVRLRDAVRGRRRLSGDDARRARADSIFRLRAFSAPSSGTMRFPTIRSSCAAAGRSIATISTRRRASAPPTWISSRLYDDYPVINVMQLEDLGFCEKGAGADFVRAQHVHGRRHAAAQHLGRADCRSGRRARRAAISAWSKPCGSSPAKPRRQGRERATRPGQRLRHDQLRSRSVLRRRRWGAHDEDRSTRPKPRNPVRALRLPTLPPPGAAARRCGSPRRRPKAASSCRTASIAARCNIRRARLA